MDSALLKRVLSARNLFLLLGLVGGNTVTTLGQSNGSQDGTYELTQRFCETRRQRDKTKPLLRFKLNEWDAAFVLLPRPSSET